MLFGGRDPVPPSEGDVLAAGGVVVHTYYFLGPQDKTEVSAAVRGDKIIHSSIKYCGVIPRVSEYRTR